MRPPCDAKNSPGGCLQLLVCFGLTLLAPPAARAASYAVELRDPNGAAVEFAVVALLTAGGGPAAVSAASPPRAIMDQRGKQFAPHVLAVQMGTPVTFPNSDAIRHHVYSFSPAKRFELRLYKGVPADPVIFDKPGPVVLGCNIHDQMLGYIYVVPTPHFGTSGSDGLVRIADLPKGRYRVEIWHPRLVGESPRVIPELELGEAEQKQAAVQLEIGALPERSRELTPLELKLRGGAAP